MIDTTPHTELQALRAALSRVVRAANDAARAARIANKADATNEWYAANAAARAADAARAAANAARAAADAGEPAAKVAANSVRAANAAARALQVTADVFARVTEIYESKEAKKPEMSKVSPVRPLGRVTVRLVGLATSVLPVVHRGRYEEEWRSLLFELGTRRARARQVLSTLAGAPRQRWALRHPLKETPPADTAALDLPWGMKW